MTVKQATDHFHHYLYGDTTEPDVEAQTAPLEAALAAVTARVVILEATIEELAAGTVKLAAYVNTIATLLLETATPKGDADAGAESCD